MTEAKEPCFSTSAEVEAMLEQTRNARIGDDTRMQCKVCWHVYDPEEGCPEQGIDPGTPFLGAARLLCLPGLRAPEGRVSAVRRKRLGERLNA